MPAALLDTLYTVCRVRCQLVVFVLNGCLVRCPDQLKVSSSFVTFHVHAVDSPVHFGD